MSQDEIAAVAQAITDAHARTPGLDSAGRLDDAKTIIAAFDAIAAFRSSRERKITKAVSEIAAKAVDPEPAAPAPAPETAADATPAAPRVAQEVPAPAPSNVTPIKPKSKGKK
jgi:hypothetical protein